MMTKTMMMMIMNSGEDYEDEYDSARHLYYT